LQLAGLSLACSAYEGKGQQNKGLMSSRYIANYIKEQECEAASEREWREREGERDSELDGRRSIDRSGLRKPRAMKTTTTPRDYAAKGELTFLKIYPTSEDRPMFDNYQAILAAFLAGAVGTFLLALLAGYYWDRVLGCFSNA
jgi:hypothetical protein